MLEAEPVGRWLTELGPDDDVAVSTRVRLARNIAGEKFGTRAGPEDQARVVAAVSAGLEEAGRLEQGRFIEEEVLDEPLLGFLLERHLVSPDFARTKLRRGLFVAEGETLSLMVNEEDHVRFQALVPGLDFPGAYRVVAELDEKLGEAPGWAFSPEYGFLTACPTNVGTGLRASVLVHLPALVLTREIEKVLRGAVHVGLAVRGIYGEGTETKGNFFQVSNQRTLGLSETEILETVEETCRQLVEYERKAREYLVENLRCDIEDKVFRSLGLLRGARILSSDEAINLLATVRLGVVLGMINELKPAEVSRLLVLVRPENLQRVLGERLKPEERDERRATFVREALVR
ncbi:protein arginine kinase [candidate division WOR-3 bacterium]|nr:protein arginine kinase [candidate division WOR-3 bacterium]